MTGWGVKMVKASEDDHEGGKVMQYTFKLERLPDQPSQQSAMEHPNTEELGDWREYEATKASKVESVADADLKGEGKFPLYTFKQST